jgi:glutamyl/glutaminyl-tRNA synthetase
MRIIQIRFFNLFKNRIMATWQDVAELLLPGVDSDIQKLLDKYPERNCVCSRIAPSPTGYLHFGSLFAALINWKYAKQNN